MSRIILSLPSKTFLAGEYLSLKGGSSLIFLSRPRFELKVDPGFISGGNIFPTESPGGKLWEKNFGFFQCYNLEYIDPHHGAGGWGSSSAQFALLHILFQNGDNLWKKHLSPAIDWQWMLKDYQDLTSASGYFKPSGADFVAQTKGGLTFFNKKKNILESFSWPFSDIGLLLVPTGTKVPTHEHLKQLCEFETETMEEALDNIYHSVIEGHGTSFIENLTKFNEELKKNNLVSAESQVLINALEGTEVLFLSKGCGALGADVLALFYKHQGQHEETALREKLKSMNLKVAATERDIDKGFEVTFV